MIVTWLNVYREMSMTALQITAQFITLYSNALTLY